MILNEEGSVLHGLNDRRPRAVSSPSREHVRSRTIVIRQGSAWPSLAFLCLCLLLLAVVLMGHQALRGLDTHNQETSAAIARSTCSVSWAALSCTRMRASPFGTTG